MSNNNKTCDQLNEGDWVRFDLLDRETFEGVYKGEGEFHAVRTSCMIPLNDSTSKMQEINLLGMKGMTFTVMEEAPKWWGDHNSKA